MRGYLDMSAGLGLKLGWLRNQDIIVSGFRALPSGGVGPAEASGSIAIRDVLLEVNEESVAGLSFSQVAKRIKNSGDRVRMKFKRQSADGNSDDE